MAALVVEGNELEVRLSRLEQVGAVSGGLRFPLTAVRSVSVTDRPWSTVRGIRAPGTGFPGLIMLGTTRGSYGKDFCAVCRKLASDTAACTTSRTFRKKALSSARSVSSW